MKEKLGSVLASPSNVKYGTVITIKDRLGGSTSAEHPAWRAVSNRVVFSHGSLGKLCRCDPVFHHCLAARLGRQSLAT